MLVRHKSLHIVWAIPVLIISVHIIWPDSGWHESAVTYLGQLVDDSPFSGIIGGGEPNRSTDSKNLDESKESNTPGHHTRALCDATRWIDGLWLSCHSSCGPDKTSICGGLNNARNRIQACLRLAMELGAGLSIPRVMARPEARWNYVNEGTAICAEVSSQHRVFCITRPA